MFKSLAGRTAVITGASKGIGRGIARRLGAVGCSVLVVARNTVESESAAREITEAGAERAPLARPWRQRPLIATGALTFSARMPGFHGSRAAVRATLALSPLCP